MLSLFLHFLNIFFNFMYGLFMEVENCHGLSCHYSSLSRSVNKQLTFYNMFLYVWKYCGWYVIENWNGKLFLSWFFKTSFDFPIGNCTLTKCWQPGSIYLVMELHWHNLYLSFALVEINTWSEFPVSNAKLLFSLISFLDRIPWS